MARCANLLFAAAALGLLFHCVPAWAGDALAGIKPVAHVPVSFKSARLDPPDAILDALAAAAKKASPPRCYWALSGKTPAEAKAVRAALGEVGVAPERTILRAGAAPAAASAYCDAPKSISLSFEKGQSTLSADARETLDFTALFIADRPADAVHAIIGLVQAGERDNPQQLAMERAITARAYLVANGIPAPRLTIKSAQGDRPGVTIAFE